MRAIHFMSVIKDNIQQNKSSTSICAKSCTLLAKRKENARIVKIESTELTEYKKLLNCVTHKIETWHKSITEKRKGKFQKDDEFIEMQPSPTKFLSRCSVQSDNDSVSSKASSACSSPKMRTDEEMTNLQTRTNSPDSSLLNTSKNRIRILKKKSKNTIKFKIKRNSTVMDSDKPESPDIKKRKSFRKYLKGSPDIQRSSRFNNEVIDDGLREQGFLELHPMHNIELVNEDGVIQELESFRSNVNYEECDSPSKYSKKSNHTEKIIKPLSCMLEFSERKSLSLAHSNLINVPIPETDELETKQAVGSTSFKYDDQKYNLHGLKRRTKYSKKIQGMSGLKWNVMSTDQNYSSNLPMIGKTRMNISNDSSSLDQLSIDILNRNNKKAKMRVEKDKFIHNILMGLIDTKVNETQDYQLSGRDNKKINYNIQKGVLRRRSERRKRLQSFGKSHEHNIPSVLFP